MPWIDCDNYSDTLIKEDDVVWVKRKSDRY